MIRVQNLSKSYQLRGENAASYRTLRDSLRDAGQGLVRRALGRGGPAADPSHVFWALNDVSFEIPSGQIVGIVGPNGAGKSTLLKILSRITRPTRGHVEYHGRIGSLLEVGTGFHHELSGRENIFLNGSILGMSRQEITARFDEIVAFAGVERFLDTPVKRYSSGMFVRLAFSVAAHLEPEILIIDEVLAVGDAEFQRKCLGKMGEVGRSGRTVLFVSHNMAAVEALCGRCLMMESGRLIQDGPTAEVLSHYHRRTEASQVGHQSLTEHAGRTSASVPLLQELTLGDGTVEPVESIRPGGTLTVKVAFSTAGKILSPKLGVVVKTAAGAPIFLVGNRYLPGFDFEHRCYDEATLTCRLENLPLMPGYYWVDVMLGEDVKTWDTIHNAVCFEVRSGDVYGSGKLPPPNAGPICWPATFELNEWVPTP